MCDPVQVFATMEKHKEVFFTIRLHSAQSAASLNPISDPDPLMPVRPCPIQTFYKGGPSNGHC
jgi:hypothetical protein